MTNEVIKLIGKNTGRDSEEIEVAVADYLSNLADRLRNSGLEEIRGFGTFTSDKGKVVFEPDPKLEEAINFRYAGLEPLEIATAARGAAVESSGKPESEASPAVEVPPAVEAPPAKETPTAVEAPPTKKTPTAVEAPPADQTVSQDTVPDEVKDSDWLPVSKRVHPLPDSPEKAPETEDDSRLSRSDEPSASDEEKHAPLEEDAPTVSEEPGVLADSESTADEAEAALASTFRRPGSRGGKGRSSYAVKTGPTRPPKKDHGSVRKVLRVMLPVVAIGVVVAWIVFNSGVFSTPGGQTGPLAENPTAASVDREQLGDEQAPTETGNRVVPEDAVASIDDSGQSGDLDSSRSPEESGIQTGGDDVSGDPSDVVRGETIPQSVRAEDTGFVSDFDRSATGYTLMVGSVFSSDDAERTMARFTTIELPKAILVFDEEGGVTRYRIAVGQFASIDEAQTEIARLGNRIPSDTWVWRIR